MFDSNFNIISGERNVGRSQFLLSISRSLKLVGSKIYFLGATHEFKDKRDEISVFDYFDFFSSCDENNTKIVEKVKEIIVSRNINLLVVDDIDYLSEKLFFMISDIPVKKIATCLHNSIPGYKFFKNLDSLNIEEYLISKNYTIISNNKKYSIEYVLISLLRDQKINSIINDKS